MNRDVLRIARRVYLVALAAAVGILLARNTDLIVGIFDEARVGFVVAALGASFGMLALSSVLWRQILVGLGSPVSFVVVLAASARSLPARYVPGGIWYAASRVVILAKRGVATPALTYTAILESVLTAGTTLGVGAIILGTTGALPGGRAWLVPGSIAIAATVAPPVAGRIASRLAAKRGIEIPIMRTSSYLAAIGAVAVFWMWSASTFLLFFRAFPLAADVEPPIVIGAFMFSWGIGFVALIAPQGIGVFELTLAGLLAQDGLVEFAIVVGGYRILIVIRDAVAATVGEAFARRGKSPVRLSEPLE